MRANEKLQACSREQGSDHITSHQTGNEQKLMGFQLLENHTHAPTRYQHTTPFPHHQPLDSPSNYKYL